MSKDKSPEQIKIKIEIDEALSRGNLLSLMQFNKSLRERGGLPTAQLALAQQEGKILGAVYATLPKATGTEPANETLTESQYYERVLKCTPKVGVAVKRHGGIISRRYLACNKNVSKCIKIYQAA